MPNNHSKLEVDREKVQYLKQGLLTMPIIDFYLVAWDIHSIGWRARVCALFIGKIQFKFQNIMFLAKF